MIKHFAPILLILCPLASYGQVSANIKYLFGQSEILDEVNLSQDGMIFSIEDGFRLKQKRLEFHPGIGFRTTWNNDNYDGFFHSIDMDLNTAIYPFDFAGDCHCPTFSNEGEFFKKGFFIEVSPGLSFQTLHRNEFEVVGDSIPDPINVSNTVFKIGGAAGLDIGLSEHLTLTPMISMTWLSPVEYEGLMRDGSAGNLDDFVNLGAGIRLAYKPDPKRRR